MVLKLIAGLKAAAIISLFIFIIKNFCVYLLNP